MELKVSALDPDEFEAAQPKGYAYGTVSKYVGKQWNTSFVYVSFG